MFMPSKDRHGNTGRQILASFLIAYFIGFPVIPALALPDGESVRAGRVNVRQFGNTMVVVQQTGSAVVNWGSFNIAGNETVRFVQPSSSAAILNRVTGGGRSTIAGNLLANGQVYLINPNGILFSGSANVNVGALVASGLNMTDRDFMTRTMRFEGGNGSVVNQGTIRAGRVTLVGGEVENAGSIRAGSATLAAGGSVVIDRALGGEIRITIDGVEQPRVSGIDVTLVDPSGPVNTNAANPGVAPTSEAQEEIDRLAGEIAPTPVITNGIVKNTGEIRVLGGDVGGQVTMRGVRVGQFGTVNADGVLGDGGDVGIFANELIIIGDESHTSANGGLFGDGGRVAIIANGLLGVQEGAYIGVRGGDRAGDGGFVDTSGRSGVDIQAFPDAIAPNGENGYWLIDPPNFFIDDDGDRRDCNFLGFDCEVPIRFDEGFAAIVPRGGTGYMDVDDMEDYFGDYRAMHIRTLGVGGSGVGDIVLEHSADIEELTGDGILIFDAAGTVFINGSISGSSGDANMIFLANDQVQVNQPVNTSGGFMLIVSGRTSGNGATFLQNNITTGGGYITVISQNSQIIHNSGAINTGSGHVFFNSSGTTFLRSSITAGRFAVNANYIQQDAGGVITTTGDVLYQTPSTINMSSGSRIISGGDVLLLASNQVDVTGVQASGSAAIISTFITDAGDAHVDIAANQALLLATNGNIGANNPIDTSVNILGGFAEGGTFRVAETAAGGNITIDTIASFTMNVAQPITNVVAPYSQSQERVTSVTQQTAPIDFSIPAFTNGVVATGGGYIEITTANGDVIVNKPVIHAGNGSVRLTANGADGDITINDPVVALNSFVRLNAQDDVIQNDVVASGNNGSLVVTAGDDLTMNPGALGFTGSGNILYSAGDDLTVASIISSNGNISALASGDIVQQSNIITLANGSIDVDAGGSLTMLNGSLALVGPNRDIRYEAGLNLSISSLISTQGDVSVRSVSGSILDAGDALPDIVGRNVMLSAPGGTIGILGGGANGLEMAAENVAARSANGINLLVGGDVNITTVGSGISVNRVNTSGGSSVVSDGTLSGYTTTANGPIVHLGNGQTTIAQPVSAGGSGNILIANSSTNSDENIVINNTISSGSGNILIAADYRVVQNAAGDITTTGGDIGVAALGENVVMANGAQTRSLGAGDVVVLAATNVTLGSVESGSGTAAIIARTGRILDGGDTHRDVIGESAVLIALNGGVGAANPIDTQIGTLAGFSQNGSFRINEADSLIISNVGPVVFNVVGTDGLISVTNIPAIPGLFVTNGVGNIEVVTTFGSITVEDPVINFADGNITLDANGFGSDLIVNDIILGADGNILLTASDDVRQITNIFNTGVGWIVVDAADSIFMTNALTFAAEGNIRYNAGGDAEISSLIASNGNISVLALNDIIQVSNIVALSGGTIDVDSSLGNVTMLDGSLSYAPDANIRYEALLDVTLASLISTQGRVSVQSTFGSILDGGDALPEIIAPDAQLVARNGGIGTLGTVTSNALELVLTNLAATAGNGGMNLVNVGDLVIGDSPAVPVNRVQANGSAAPIGGVFVSGLTTTNNGAISLVNLGSVDVERMVAAHGTGNVVISTAVGAFGPVTVTVANINLNTNVLSGTGNISLLSGSDINQAKDGNVFTISGDIAAAALDGNITMTDGSRSFSDGGDVAYVAGTNLLISSLQAGTGQVAAIAIDGDVLDNGDILTDVLADGLFIVSVGGEVGQVANRIDTDINVLSGAALNGGVHITEDDDLIIAQVGPIGVDVVLPDNKAFQTNLPAFNGLVASNGSLLVDTVLGDITIDGVAGTLGDGNVRIAANGGGSDLTINETVFSFNGPISLLAAQSININTSVASQGSGTIDIEAFNGGITMADNGLVVAGAGDVRMFARGDIVLGSVIATQSAVHIESSLGSLLDGGDILPDIIAARAQLVATNGGVGVLGEGVDQPLVTGIGTLSARVSDGGFNIINGGDLTIGTVVDVVTDRVNADDSTTTFNAGSLSGVMSTNAGTIVAINRGSVTVDDPVIADGTGNILLLTQTGEVASVDLGADVIVNAPIDSGSGVISVIAGQDFLQNVGGDITSDGDIGLVTREGDWIQQDGVKVESGLGNIVAVSSSNLYLAAVHALTGSVTLTSVDGTIFDAGDTDLDLIANEVQLWAFNGGVGVDTNGIETTISKVAGLAANGSFKLTETDDLVIGAVDPIIVSVVDPDGGTSTTNFPALAGIIVSNGNLLVDTLDGSILVESPVLNGGDGNVLLKAAGEGSDIDADALIFTQNGNLSVIASNDVRQTDSIISFGTGTVDVMAETGSITMSGSNIVGYAGNGAVRYQAREDVTIASLISPSNTVSIIAENGSILDGGDDLKDVLAPSLRMQAGTGAGTTNDALDTLIGFISARAGTGGVHVVNDGILLVTTISNVVTERVLLDGTTTSIVDVTQSDIITTNGGSVSLETVNGSIIVFDGEAPQDGIGIDADGGGGIRLTANGSNSYVLVDADLISDFGHICLSADSHIIINTNTREIATGGRGSIALWADNDDDGAGDIYQLGGNVNTANGNIYYYGENIRLLNRSRITSFAGSISIKAGNDFTMSRQARISTLFGSIAMEGNNNLTINGQVRGGTVALTARRGSIKGGGKVTANALSMRANRSIGTERDPFDINAGDLAVETTRGDVFLIEEDSVNIGPIPAINLRFGVPECAANIPVATARALDEMQVAGLLQFEVGADLSGNTINVGGDATVDVNGSVNGLDTLQAGGDILLTVGGNYDGSQIIAGGDLDAVIGGNLDFDLIEAGRVDVTARNIQMSRVVARNFAFFKVGSTVFDDRSLIIAPDIIMTAGGDIGPNGPINLNVQRIDRIQAGGNLNIVQLKPGETLVNVLQAGGNMNVSVPQGGLLDRNGGDRNLIASSATINSRFLGTLDDPLEVRIVPGNLKVDNAGLSGNDTPEGYVWIHLEGEIGKVNDRKIDYIGRGKIPGLIIYNNVILGGKDEVLRKFKRGSAFLSQVPVLSGPKGVAGDFYFLDMDQPGVEGWEQHIYYIIREMSEINGLPAISRTEADDEAAPTDKVEADEPSPDAVPLAALIP